jgi:uncharacterized protein YkwD
MEIHVTKDALSTAALQKAEDKLLHAKGQWLGTASRSTLNFHAATYQTAKAMIQTKNATYGVLVAGVVRNHLTYLLVDTVRDPAGKAGKLNAKVEQGILASLTFTKPAAAGSFTCAGTGISQPAIALPKVTATSPPTSTAAPSATLSSTATVTPTPSATSTALPAPTATAIPTSAPLPGGIPTSGTTTNGCPIVPAQASGEAHMLALLNADRAEAGVPPLTLSTALSVVARDHSCDMGTHDNPSHTGSDGSDPLQRLQAAGITYTTAGENVGVSSGHGFLPGLDGLDQAMMAEQTVPITHRWNIVNPAYHEVGIGVVVVGAGIWLTEDFVG